MRAGESNTIRQNNPPVPCKKGGHRLVRVFDDIQEEDGMSY